MQSLTINIVLVFHSINKNVSYANYNNFEIIISLECNNK